MNRVGTFLLVIFGGFIVVVGVIAACVCVMTIKDGRGGNLLPPLIIAVGGVAVGAAMIIWGVRRSFRSAAATKSSDGQQVGDYVPNLWDTRMLGERSYMVQYSPPVKGKNGRPSSLVVQVPCFSPVELRFKNENWFDRWAKRWGIVHECHTGDDEFDNEVYVRCPSDGYIDQVLADGDKRLAVRALLRHGMKEVRLTGTHVEAAWQGFDPATDDKPNFCQDTAAGLFVLADSLPCEDPDYEVNLADRRSKWNVLLWVFAITLAATFGMMFWYTPVYGDELFWAGLTLFAFVYPLFAVVAVVLLRGKSTSHDRLLVLLGAGLLLLGFGCMGAIATVNGLADNSRPHERRVTIASKNTSRSKNKTNYRVFIPAWDRPGETIKFGVSWEEYNRVQPGRSLMNLTTRDGALGIEWIEKEEVQP